MLAVAPVARAETSAAVAAAYQPAERKQLPSRFVGAVTRWLERYERKVLEERPDYVRMQVRYDYVYDLELTIEEDRYEIKVTGSERSRGTPNGQRNARNLAAGILKAMEEKKRRRNANKDRWSN
jgi:hypothetical protein